jgi:uncharacterized membrane protein
MDTVEGTRKTSFDLTTWLPRFSVLLAVIGLIDSLYLTWVKVAHPVAFCGGVGGCEAVNSSAYSQIGGVPIALLGAGAYLAMLVLLGAERLGESWAEWSLLGVFGLSLVGTLYSAYLTYIEVAVLHEICPYCVVSAIVITTIFIISVIRLRRTA